MTINEHQALALATRIGNLAKQVDTLSKEVDRYRTEPGIALECAQSNLVSAMKILLSVKGEVEL